MFGRRNRPLWTPFPKYEDSRLDGEQARSGRAADGGLRAALLAVRRRESASESRHRRHSSSITIQGNDLGPTQAPQTVPNERRMDGTASASPSAIKGSGYKGLDEVRP